MSEIRDEDVWGVVTSVPGLEGLSKDQFEEVRRGLEVAPKALAKLVHSAQKVDRPSGYFVAALRTITAEGWKMETPEAVRLSDEEKALKRMKTLAVNTRRSMEFADDEYSWKRYVRAECRDAGLGSDETDAVLEHGRRSRKLASKDDETDHERTDKEDDAIRESMLPVEAVAEIVSLLNGRKLRGAEPLMVGYAMKADPYVVKIAEACPGDQVRELVALSSAVCSGQDPEAPDPFREVADADPDGLALYHLKGWQREYAHTYYGLARTLTGDAVPAEKGEQEAHRRPGNPAPPKTYGSEEDPF